MTENKIKKRKRLFTSIAAGCGVIGALLLTRIIGQASRGESLEGYSNFSVAFSFLVALTLAGLITGQIGLIRGEKPVALPVAILLLNALVFLTAIVFVPR